LTPPRAARYKAAVPSNSRRPRGVRTRAAPTAGERFASLPTERPNPRTRILDRLPTESLVATITREDGRAARSVAAVRRPLARAVRVVAAALRDGGRLVYAGAGTSGRLGVLDAAECPPTFGVARGRVTGVIAGGRRALWQAVEGAEDRAADARRALARLRVSRRDVVCGICASGVTPFALAALREARRRGARTVAVTCAPSAELRALADVVIAPRPGPEVLAGSTRMKAGLATKMVLHTLTTAAMVRLGRVYGNRMVDLQPTSRKLRARARRIVAELTGLPPAVAAALARRAGDRPAVALLMHRLELDARSARRRLRAHAGNLRAALASSDHTSRAASSGARRLRPSRARHGRRRPGGGRRAGRGRPGGRGPA
jgi:N-acetylmuramic acid 6-phosphate etherase